MPTDEFIAHRKGPSAHLKEIGWEAYYGTTQSGNLPHYRQPEENPCNIDMSKITMPEVTLKDFHYYHIKCPYSTQAAQGGKQTYVRDVNPLSDTYMQMLLVGILELTDHTATKGVMIKCSRGSRYGWTCVDDECYYYTTVSSGSRYFYV
jgi:hypothetical protein